MFSPTDLAPSQPSEAVSALSLSDNRVNEWRDAGIVLLVGSYISTFSPTNLPMGWEFGLYLWNLLFGTRKSDGKPWPEWLRGDFRKVPFEVLMQCYPDRQAIRSAVQLAFGISLANPVHALLAEQLRAGSVRSIITTNYDLCLDEVLRNTDGLCTVWNERTYNQCKDTLHSSSKVYWKIHGTATPGKEELDSLIFDLVAEGRMPEWKRRLMATVITDKSLVVVGYSGRDFEICPQLAYKARPRHVVWLEPGALTPNAKRVLIERKGARVIGKLEDFLPRLFLKPLDLTKETPSFNLAVDRDLIPEWRARILDWMACGRVVLPEITALGDAHVRTELLRSTYGHLGRYRDSVREVEKQAAEPTLNGHDKLQLQLSAASSWFIFGSHLKGWMRTNAIERQIVAAGFSDLRVEAVEVKLMVAMRLTQIARLTRLRFLVTAIQRSVERDYKTAREELERLGAWGRL